MAEDPELEDVALDIERRRFVLKAFERIDRLTHYEVLGVSRTADKKELKTAYYAIVAILHPDRYFGKNLGSYKPKMEALFSRASVAYEVLSARDKRAEYDAALGPERAAPGSQPPTPKTTSSIPPRTGSIPSRAPVSLKQQGAMNALKARFDSAKAHELVEAGERAVLANDFIAAEAAYAAALALLPNDAALRQKHDAIRERAIGGVIDGLVKKAAIEEHLGQWEQAAMTWRRVLVARPDDAGVKARLAHALAKAGRLK